jgi:hypothetical protein
VDPRDKVYGLLGLIYETHLPTVDCSKPLTAVFVDTIKVLHDEYWTRSLGLSDGVPAFTVVKSSNERPRPPYMLVAYALQILRVDDLGLEFMVSELDEYRYLDDWYAWLLDTLDAHGGFDAAIEILANEEGSVSGTESSP